ncbi:hypothetical protein C8J57DRAFT_1468303 [Mycena rebaudengoi]|nr:hypothetical protein C8J57DRAFT_1468303 [Mycena rebaudengoi]
MVHWQAAGTEFYLLLRAMASTEQAESNSNTRTGVVDGVSDNYIMIMSRLRRGGGVLKRLSDGVCHQAGSCRQASYMRPSILEERNFRKKPLIMLRCHVELRREGRASNLSSRSNMYIPKKVRTTVPPAGHDVPPPLQSHWPSVVSLSCLTAFWLHIPTLRAAPGNINTSESGRVFVVKKGGQAARMCEMFQIHSWAAVLGRSTEKMRIQAGPVKLSPVCELGKAAVTWVEIVVGRRSREGAALGSVRIREEAEQTTII